MNISIPHDVFLSAIEKGGLAVYGSSIDGSVLETIPTQRCVKLSAKDGALTVESSVNKASSKFICKNDAIKISEEGELCVDSSEIKSNLTSLKYPHMISFSFDESSADPKAGKPGDTIVPLGKVQFRAVNDAGREAFKVGLTAYSVNDFVLTSYPDEVAPTLGIQAKALDEAIGAVSFSSGEDQFTEIFNHLCLVSIGDSTHLAATDNKRAALTTFAGSTCTGDTNGQPILIDTKLAKETMKRMPKDDSIIYIVLDADNEHVCFRTPDFQVRISMPPVEARKRFPAFANAVNMEVGASVVFSPRKEIEQTVARHCASSSSLASFKIETGSETVDIKGWNTGIEGTVGCQKIQVGLKSQVFLDVNHISDVIGKIKADSMKFSFSTDEKKVIVQSVDSPIPFYLMQRILPTDI